MKKAFSIIIMALILSIGFASALEYPVIDCSKSDRTFTINKTQIEDKNTEIGRLSQINTWMKAGLVLLFLVSLGLLVWIASIYSMKKPKIPIKTICATAMLLFSIMIIPTANAETFTTSIRVNMTNASIMIHTESGDFPFPFIPGMVYAPSLISIERNSSITVNNYTTIINNTLFGNQSFNFSCPAPIVNSQCLCPSIDYSQINATFPPADVNLENVTKACNDAKSSSESIAAFLVNSNESSEEGEKKEGSWVLWLIISISIVLFLMAAAFIVWFFVLRKKKPGEAKQKTF